MVFTIAGQGMEQSSIFVWPRLGGCFIVAVVAVVERHTTVQHDAAHFKKISIVEGHYDFCSPSSSSLYIGKIQAMWR